MLSTAESATYITTMALDRMVAKFKADLTLNDNASIESELENDLLRQWFFGLPVVCADQQGIIAIRAISLTKLSQNFFKILPMRCTVVIRTMWESNTELQQSYRDNHTFSDEELILNFKRILSSHVMSVLRSVWKDNIRLQKAIRNLSFDESKDLLSKVLSIYGKGVFAKPYLEWLDDKELFRSVFYEIKNESKNSIRKVSRFQSGKLGLLHHFLKGELHTDISKETNPLKRKASDLGNKNKKQRTKMEVTPDLIEKMPQILEEDYFFVTRSVAEHLKNLSMIVREEMGLISILKTVDDDRFKVTIADLFAYYTFLSQHSSLKTEPSYSFEEQEEQFVSVVSNFLENSQPAMLSITPSVQIDECKSYPSFFEESFAFFSLDKQEVDFFSEILEPTNNNDLS